MLDRLMYIQCMNKETWKTKEAKWKDKKLMLESDISISMPCYVIHVVGVYYICFKKVKAVNTALTTKQEVIYKTQ